MLETLQAVNTSQITDLDNQLQMSKLFLNMVIHDLRNPISSIKLGLQETIVNIQDMEKIFQEQKEFVSNQKSFNYKFRKNINKFTKSSCQSLVHQNLMQMRLDGDNTALIVALKNRV